MTFSEKLQRARKNKAMTQVELAEKIGVTARSVQNYEMGARYPKRDILARICKVLGVRIETLVGSDDFFGIVEAEDGAQGVESAKELLSCAGALFAGGKLSEEDKDKVMLALQNIYWKEKAKSMKTGGNQIEQ
ncbi:MAG: helix-turn-helix domain-containing protein [Ruminiclostridium sp.]|nr:helix-turn-helix domain-containing protein [Ruminiclostridium sp.]